MTTRLRFTDPAVAARLGTIAGYVLRYGLVVLILWYGLFKFTAAEARAIEPLLSDSPFLSWLYGVTDVDGASRVIGLLEIVIAVLIALRPLSPRASAAGSAGAVLMFLTTLSFLATTPGMFRKVEWIVVPGGGGGFIIKDLLLLGAALWTLADALAAAGPGALVPGAPVAHRSQPL
jgi:uncharacterized membrane protein YkgB